ncbi:VENN motif pre-toxin domain-containing protein [Pantoea vagans]|uniref:VENN motif pre-toxin domain-containing protein n=1 Tax=Pantoea vagans TaxID=470934 RepID=UPI00289CFB45|nr:ribonuclease domain-containing protein [Pantoea vagans]
MNSEYASVGDQSGLFAGNGGYDIYVGNHTQLNGAVIASTAQSANNALSTGTLGWSDIDNHASYKASSSSISMGGGNEDNKMSGGAIPTSANTHGSASGTTRSAVADGTITVRNGQAQTQNVADLSRDTDNANGHIDKIFDKDKVSRKLEFAQRIQELGQRVAGDISSYKMQAAEKETLERLLKANPQNATLSRAALNDLIVKDEGYKAVAEKWGTGGSYSMAAAAVTGVLGGLGASNLGAAAAGGMAPYIANKIKHATSKFVDGQEQTNVLANTMAHAVAGAVLAQLAGNSATAGAAGAAGGELMARAILSSMYPGKQASDLTQEEKQVVSALGQLAAQLSAGVASGSVEGGIQGAVAGKNAVENNYLSDTQNAQKKEELAECKTVACKAQTQAKWTAIDLGQDGSFAAGMIAGVPAGLYDAVDGIVRTASSPLETYAALKSLFNSGDVLGNVSDAVKQSYIDRIDRIDRMEAEYQRAGASGSFNAGVEGGKLVADMAGLLAGGAGVVKGGVVLTEKIAAKVAGKADLVAVNVGNAAHNAANYAGLKLDLKTTEAANHLVESLRNTGQLPESYIDKAQAMNNGWKSGKALNNTSPGKQIGGDIFENSNNLLPSSPGRVWREADVGLDNTMSRSNQAGTRLLYSDDGLLYITTDHYETATSIGKWK